MKSAHSNRIHRGGLRALLLTLLTLLCALPAGAREWYYLDSMPPGTPAEVTVDATASSAQSTKLDVVIHGFWMIDRVGDDERSYKQIVVPGLGDMDQVGAPDLPMLRARLGVLTGAEGVTVAGYEAALQTTLTDILVWPQPHEETEPTEGNVPETFVLDSVIYEREGVWPGTPVLGADALSKMRGNLPVGTVECRPFQYDALGRLLTVSQVSSYWFDHGGVPQPIGPLTRDTVQLLEGCIPNWPQIDDLVSVGWWQYEADYLIITPGIYEDALDEFINLKKAQGYYVTVLHWLDIGGNCNDIRAAIADWYDNAPTNRDKYCLLIGDEDIIPLCTSPDLNTEAYPGGILTEDLYGSVNGDDLDEEVYVGRLSVDHQGDLENQLDRIVAYQTGIQLFTDYSQVALVAHREDAPGKYVGAHEAVRTANYSNPPVFQTYYGNEGATNQDVSDAIDDGLGLVAYRGHGSSSAWTSWNVFAQYYDDSDISALSNTQHPAVWSFSCTNSKIQNNDCVAEKWMEQVEHGAISHYGSIVASYTSQNHVLNSEMFRALYDDGLNIQAQTIELAEARAADLGKWHNPWMYMLLGDPSMRIRTSGPIGWDAVLPDEIIFQPGVPFDLDLILAADGQADPDVLFSVYKPGEDGVRSVDEAFDNTYTGAAGTASLTLTLETEGMLYYTLRGPGGEAVYDSIPVRRETTGVPNFASQELRFWAEPSITSQGASLMLSRGLDEPTDVSIYDASGRLVRKLDIAAQRDRAAWDGRDTGGRTVPNGVYLARLGDARETRTARLVVLR